MGRDTGRREAAHRSARGDWNAADAVTGEGKSPVQTAARARGIDPEYPGDAVAPWGKPGGPPPKARGSWPPIVESTVRER